MNNIYDKIKGGLFGGAIGDALGYPVEFLEAVSIFKKYGEFGICEYDLCDGMALISDDTQMTMFTAEGILRAKAKNGSPTDEEYIEEIYRAYIDWLATQSSKYDPNALHERSALLGVKEMYSQRAPGNTCLSALGSGRCGTFENRLNNSKGCGGVMRIAPIAFLLGPNERIPLERIGMLCARASAITHSHPLGYIPAAYLGFVIGSLMRGDVLIDAIVLAKEWVEEAFEESDYTGYFIELIEKAISLAEDTDIDDDLDAIVALGEGWVAEETVAIAVYCALRHGDDFEGAVIASVNHSGDSDSTGAVTGNIVGALLGYSLIPEEYIADLELTDELERLSHELSDKSGIV